MRGGGRSQLDLQAAEQEAADAIKDLKALADATVESDDEDVLPPQLEGAAPLGAASPGRRLEG